MRYMLHIKPEAPPFFPIEIHRTLGIFTVIGCVNQSVVNIRQFAAASCSGSVPSSMEMAGSSKCGIHRRQRYKIVPSIFFFHQTRKCDTYMDIPKMSLHGGWKNFKCIMQVAPPCHTNNSVDSCSHVLTKKYPRSFTLRNVTFHFQSLLS